MPWASNTLRQLIFPAQIVSSIMCQNSNVCFNLQIVFMTIKVLFTNHAVYHRMIYSCIATSGQWKHNFLHALVCVVQKGLLSRGGFLFISLYLSLSFFLLLVGFFGFGVLFLFFVLWSSFFFQIFIVLMIPRCHRGKFLHEKLNQFLINVECTVIFYSITFSFCLS